ncbi:alpha/beta hydrolase [Nonlabens agnitus]|uniref:Serine aminopeptidase S33 domain-containing protein n=1 Tax=Nonlabens agnitus TaxID=870484 RepID=A0A2S9WVE9_9FLAO|nr:alpha/beta fold hydrolase [Nonlabens agnitus]PRP67460.1 hypothetical protein BST86_10330 [Nonlabens agnitus]
MKNTLLISFVFAAKLIFCQTLNNEKEIKNISDFDLIEVSSKIDNDITIFGTLLKPKSEFEKLLIIVSGTGEISQKAHNYLTEYLLENNIAVFRFDKRGVGKSTGTYDDRLETYTNDFTAIYHELRAVNSVQNKTIGFLGHSLGGLVTIQVIKNGVKPNFLIQWASPIGKPREIAKYQIENGFNNYDKYISAKSIKEKTEILEFVHGVVDENVDLGTWDMWKTMLKEARKKGFKRKQFKNYISNYFVDFAKIDNTNTYKNIDLPTLIIIGQKDLLVDPKQSKADLLEIENPNIVFKQIEELGHFMTDIETDQSTNDIYDVDPSFKEYLVDWVNKINL